jgi:hypothetical protein
MEVKVNKMVGFKVSLTGTGTKYTVNANVSAENDNVTSVENGTVKDTDAELANFSGYGPGSLSINFKTSDDTVMASILADVTAFISYCKSNIASLSTVSVSNQ